MPTKPALSNPIFKVDGFTENSFGSGNTKKNLVQFDLSDPAEENFYTVALYATVQDTITKKTYTNSDYHELDQQFNGSIFDDTYGIKHTVTDAVFNGKKFNFRMGTFSQFFYWEDEMDKPLENIKLLKYRAIVYGISKEKYLYEATLEAQDNGFDALFGEAIVVNSNIKNGFGIFSVRNVNSIDILVK